MAMGGGTFTVQNKILPGAYINFVAKGGNITTGERGVAVLPLVLNWGEEGKIVSLSAADFTRLAPVVFGYDATDPALLLVRECFKRAKTLKFYRVSGGEKAANTVGGIAVTAKYSGSRGNDIRVGVNVNVDEESKFDVVTYLEETEVDRQTVAAASELAENEYVTFGGEGTLTAAAAASLAGGSDGVVDGSAYTAFLNALEVEDFNVVGYPGGETEIKALFAAFVKRLREDEGKKVTCVLANYANADYEGIVSVKNGVLLETGETLTPEQAVAWVTGASAAAQINDSLTNAAYEGAVDAFPKYTKSGYEDAIRAGEFCFYADRSKARVLTDINTLLTFGGGKSQDWTSNRVIRVMDAWANDAAQIFNERYIGLQTNNDIGRQLFKADLVALALQYQAIEAISNFDSKDITIQQGSGKRDVLVNCALQPNDSMEKLYMIVTLM